MSASRSTPIHRRLLGALALLAALTPRLAAHAQDAVPASEQTLHATIVHIDGHDVVIDAGDAAIGGARLLTVFRTLQVRHPVTHKPLRDRFAIGTLSVTQTGSTLSVTHVSGTPSHDFEVGDSVEIETDHAAAANLALQTQTKTTPITLPPTAASGSAQPVSSAASASAPAVAPATTEDRDLLAYWKATLAKPPEWRVRLYQGFLQKYPTSRYRDFVTAEITYLNGAVGHARAERAVAAATAPSATLTLSAPRSAEEDEAVEIAASLRSERAVRSLILHARALEHDGFDTIVMTLDERGHARGTVPAGIVRAPGFAFFVEAVDDKGEPMAVHGSVNAPSIVTVKPKKHPAKPTGPATRVRFASEIVSFDGVSGRDYFLLNEGDFLYRVRFHELYALRMGYGTYRGEGGTVEQLDTLQLDPKPAGFTYGFVETDFELHRLFGLAVRGTLGLGRPDDPNEQRNAVTGGFQLRARIGAVDATHLEVAGELMPEIGQRAYLGLHWEAIENFPMATEVVVTDQPVNSDELAVRLVYEIGYRFTDRIAIALRPSYQLRTIRHAGPGVGLAATFDW